MDALKAAACHLFHEFVPYEEPRGKLLRRNQPSQKPQCSRSHQLPSYHFKRHLALAMAVRSGAVEAKRVMN